MRASVCMIVCQLLTNKDSYIIIIIIYIIISSQNVTSFWPKS